jgi:hypothetical protein
MYVDVKFISVSKENVLVLPVSSIVKKNDTSCVLLYDNGKTQEREVKTGISIKIILR